jgi:hypothetical protein
VDTAHDSIITAGNGGTKPIQAQVSIFYNSGTGKYVLEQTLAPEQQLWLDLGKLIREQAPDKDGHRLPPDLTSGTYQFRDLTDPAVGNIFEGKVIVDKTFGHAAYGCMICCGYPDGGSMQLNPLTIVLGAFTDQYVQAVESCGGTMDDVTALYGTWGTGNTAIATANRNRISGVSAGSTSHFASTQLNRGDGLTYVKHCPVQLDNPSAPANVRIPYRGSPIRNRFSQPTGFCASGFAGWDRGIVAQIFDQFGVPFITDGIQVGENVNVASRNELLVPTQVQTGSGMTAFDSVSGQHGTYVDEFFFCSTQCPASTGETDALQVLNWNGIGVSHSNAIIYKCGSITDDGN